jgi:hypothetical protein
LCKDDGGLFEWIEKINAAPVLHLFMWMGCSLYDAIISCARTTSLSRGLSSLMALVKGM